MDRYFLICLEVEIFHSLITSISSEPNLNEHKISTSKNSKEHIHFDQITVRARAKWQMHMVQSLIILDSSVIG